MATNFPNNIDTYTDIDGSIIYEDDPFHSHDSLHNLAGDAIVAIETKVGKNSSSDTTSIDYKLSGIPATDKAASKTGAETLTNKTLTSPTITSPVIQLVDGWSKVSVDPTKGAGQTLVFAGVDLTPYIKAGYPIKLTDTTTKYFFATDVTFSTNTTVTVTGGSDYTLVGIPSAGTFRYSNSNPVGFPANSATFSPLGVAYAETSTATQCTTATDLTGLSITITVPTGKRIKIVGDVPMVDNASVDGANVDLRIQEGSTVLGMKRGTIYNKSYVTPGLQSVAITSPTAGSHTYKLVGDVSSGSARCSAASSVSRIWAEII